MRPVLALLLLLPLFVQAQTITGTLQSPSGQPIVGGTVSLRLPRAPKPLRSTLTDAAGTFRLVRPVADTLVLEATATGFLGRDTLLPRAPGDVSLPLWNLSARTAQLDTFRVVAGKPLVEVQADKTVLNVANSVLGSGGNALELVGKAPGVLVDKDDRISMNGKNGVRIYIDGRPSPLSVEELTALLRTIPASDVEAIEIMTNPPARYEAAGNAGILNIRLKRNRSWGTNGTANAGWSVGIFPKYNAGLSLNHRNRALQVFGNYSFQQYRNQGFMNLFRFQNDSLYDQRSVTQSRGGAHNLRAGADWYLTKQKTLGVLVSMNRNENRNATDSRTPIAAQGDKVLRQTLVARNRDKRQRTNLSANLNYRFADTTGRVLSIDADYGYYRLEAQALSPNTYFDPQGAVLQQSRFGSRTPVEIRFASLQGSWERKWRGGTLQLGFRSAQARTDNRFSFFRYAGEQPVLDEERSNAFAYREGIHAVFGQFNRKGKTWGYSVGLRAEYTSSLGELSARNPVRDRRVDRDYGNLFPNLGFTWQAGASSQLALSYGRRIDRPSYQDLNPFENQLDELTYQKGNPFLRPQLTNIIEVKHTYKYKWSASLSYSDVQDFFAAITDTVEGRRNFITQRNLASQKVWALNSSLPFTVTKWWTVFASAGLVHSRYRAELEPGKAIRINATVANLYQQHSFRLGKKISGELSSFYMSPYVWAGTYECRSIWNLDAGLQWKILRENGTLRLSVTDIFQRMPWRGTSRLGALFIDASGGWESRQLRLNFSYRFGNKEVKGARQRGTGLDELNRRVGG